MKVLMPLDGSEFGKAVVPVARRLLEVVEDVELHLLTVVDPREAVGHYHHEVFAPLAVGDATSGTVVRLPEPSVAENHGDAMNRRQVEAADWLSGVAQTDFGYPAQIHVEWSSKPGPSIIAVANSIGADMILMPTHGRSGISHMLTGSVTEGVIRGSGRPVLVVGPSQPA